MKKREKGFASWEVLVGCAVLAIGISICAWLIGYLQSVKAERRANSPLLQKKFEKKKVPVEPGDEFGSYVIRFDL